MLAGWPFAGKSMLVGGLLKAVEAGEPFLGHATTPATAMIVTEEDSAALRGRADVLGLLDLRGEFIGRSTGAFNLSWPKLIETATEHALKAGHRLLVVDTFPGLADLEDEDENKTGAITKRLRPLQAAAGRGLSVPFLHHLNSSGQPRGSKALKGIVDAAVRLYRRDGARTVELKTESRFPTATEPLVKGRLIQAPRRLVLRGG